MSKDWLFKNYTTIVAKTPICLWFKKILFYFIINWNKVLALKRKLVTFLPSSWQNCARHTISREETSHVESRDLSTSVRTIDMSVTRAFQILFSSASHVARKPHPLIAPTVRYYSCKYNNDKSFFTAHNTGLSQSESAAILDLWSVPYTRLVKKKFMFW